MSATGSLTPSVTRCLPTPGGRRRAGMVRM
jgi:hypothetical protein